LSRCNKEIAAAAADAAAAAVAVAVPPPPFPAPRPARFIMLSSAGVDNPDGTDAGVRSTAEVGRCSIKTRVENAYGISACN